MSNFLQRVAAAVIQPQAKLQPILGSIFAPATLRSPADSFPADAEISSQTFAPHRQEPMAAPSFDTSRLAGRDRLLPTTAQEEFSPARSNRSLAADQPLLPVVSPGNLRKPTHAHPFIEDLGPASESSKPAAANQSTSPASYQPLIAASQQPAPKLQPREPMPAAAAMRPSRAEAARRSQPAQREADEIHIHIGRIEVAAITQQAPRPTAAAARRSLNLDDYLRRGNGRPG